MTGNQSDDAVFHWLDMPNPFSEGTDPWCRTEKKFCLAAKRNPAFRDRDPRATLVTLAGRRLIKLEGYRGRANVDEMEEFRDALHAIVGEGQPMTVRQVFYQATVRNIVEKEERGYDKVQQTLAKMRRDGVLPFNWIVDNTRSRHKAYTNDSVAQALRDTAETYRKSLWSDIDAHVEIWLEKDALSGVISPITEKYDVSLMVARGYSSLSFLFDAAQYIRTKRCPVHIYHLGDFDPSGVNAGEKIEEDLRGFAPDADIHFTRLAVTENQIDEWDLPKRPTKKSDSRAKNFDSDTSVELDAIEPRQLRSLVERVVRRHMPRKKYDELMQAERREQNQIRKIVEDLDME